MPFLASVPLIVLGLDVRLRVSETPEFTQLKQQARVARQPVRAALRHYPREILTAALLRTSEQAPFFICTTLVLT